MMEIHKFMKKNVDKYNIIKYFKIIFCASIIERPAIRSTLRISWYYSDGLALIYFVSST